MSASWPTVIIMLGIWVLLGLAMYLDHSIIAGVVGILGTITTAQLPQLIQRQGTP